MDPTRNVGIALRTLNILGQVLKNFPGTLEKNPKLKVAKTSYELGLRTLSYILAIIKDTREDLVHEAVERIRSDNPEEDVMEIREKVQDLLASICQAVSFGMIRRTVNAVGSSELSKTCTEAARFAVNSTDQRFLKAQLYSKVPFGKSCRACR